MCEQSWTNLHLPWILFFHLQYPFPYTTHFSSSHFLLSLFPPFNNPTSISRPTYAATIMSFHHTQGEEDLAHFTYNCVSTTQICASINTR